MTNSSTEAMKERAIGPLSENQGMFDHDEICYLISRKHLKSKGIT